MVYYREMQNPRFITGHFRCSVPYYRELLSNEAQNKATWDAVYGSGPCTEVDRLVCLLLVMTDRVKENLVIPNNEKLVQKKLPPGNSRSVTGCHPCFSFSFSFSFSKAK